MKSLLIDLIPIIRITVIPESVRFTRSLWEDCARRDFTINALCWHPDLGLRDYFHGQRDLKNKVIACIGNPYQRFDEDALRILRALRFASTLGFALDLGNASGALSSERIAAGVVCRAHCPGNGKNGRRTPLAGNLRQQL